MIGAQPDVGKSIMVAADWSKVHGKSTLNNYRYKNKQKTWMKMTSTLGSVQRSSPAATRKDLMRCLHDVDFLSCASMAAIGGWPHTMISGKCNQYQGISEE